MNRRLRISLLLSLVFHLGFISPAEAWTVPEESSTNEKAGGAEGEPIGNDAQGKRLNVDFDRMSRIRDVVAKTLKYHRNAPKGFEGMVRSALSLLPSSAEGSAKVSFTFDPSGNVRGVDIRSDSPELKTALGRIGWEAGPLPTRYQIPCSGLNVNVTVAGPNLSVAVEIL